MAVVLTNPITPARMKVLIVIGNCISGIGEAPTNSEIADALGLHSTNGVRKHIKKLVADGFLRHEAGKRRNIALTALSISLLRQLGAQ